MINNIYLDNAATTRVDPAVLDAMMPWFSVGFGNPSASHGMGRTAKLAVEMARKRIATLLNCPPGCIVFTSGGTESANIAVHAAARAHGIQSFISSPTEHKCVLQSLKAYANKIDLLPLDAAGVPDLKALEDRLASSEERQLVCLMHANNETGAILDVAAAAKICAHYDALFFCDTVATIGHLPIDLAELNVSMCSASAHKFHGPKGVGFIYVREGLDIAPMIHGGAQEAGLRAGTENVASIVGMAEALDIAIRNQQRDRLMIETLREQLAQALVKAGAEINSPENGIYTILNAGFEAGERTEQLLMQLDMAGVCVSGGSACNAGGNAASHVMTALGKADRVNIRFSFSKFNSMSDINGCVQLISSLLHPNKFTVA